MTNHEEELSTIPFDTSGDAPSMRERILARALHLFNQSGIEYVAVRELARDLGIKGGNITHYFPTKDDIIVALASRLQEIDERTVSLPGNPTLYGFMEMNHQVFRNHHEFRCLFLSLPKLMQNPAIAGHLRSTVAARREGVLLNYLTRLQEAGLLTRTLGRSEATRIVSFLALVHHGWIIDGSVSFRERSPGWRMSHYLHIVADHLRGFATIGGRVELQRFVRELD
jgi:AcrR family transcriptional regulator